MVDKCEKDIGYKKRRVVMWALAVKKIRKMAGPCIVGFLCGQLYLNKLKIDRLRSDLEYLSNNVTELVNVTQKIVDTLNKITEQGK